MNWTNLLGQVMLVCNSHSGQKKYSVSSYEAVFGQRFHPQLKSKQEEMRQCRSIFQRLKLSPDECLETYVRENDIVDIGYDDDAVTAAADIVTDDDDVDDEDDKEGMEINDDSFPELATDNDNVDDNVDYFDVDEMELPRQTSDVTQDVGVGVEVKDNNDIAFPQCVVKSVPNDTTIDGIGRKTPSSLEDWLVEQPRAVPTYEESLVLTTRSRTFSTFNLAEAWVVETSHALSVL